MGDHDARGRWWHGTAGAHVMIVMVLKPAILILSVTALLNTTWVTAKVMLAARFGMQFGYLGVPLRGRASSHLEFGWALPPPVLRDQLIDDARCKLRALAMINRKRRAVASLGAAIVTFLMGAPADAATLESNRVYVEYVPPKSPAHDVLYKLVRERRVLETIRDHLVPFRLPRRLLLKAQGCDGVVNAWYDDGVITVCYEYLDWVWRSAPEQTTPAGITTIDGLAGPVVQFIMHEAGHAIFDLLKVPIFGREEDAADQFAAYVTLQAGKEEARRLMAGAAYQYKGGVQSESKTISTKSFADEHGTIAQRFFNILCLAYGADEELFKDIVANGYLPKERAEGCSDEYAQVAYAFNTLIGPYIDRKLAAKLHKNWLPPINSPPPPRPAGLNTKPPQQ